MKKILRVITSLAPTLALVAFISTVALTAPAAAFEQTVQDGANAARGADQTADLFGSTGIFKTITNVLLFILGAISVIMIIIGGLRYVISGGNSTSVTAAKNTILYAIVGIIVALLSFAIINFVLGSITGGAGGGSAGTNV